MVALDGNVNDRRWEPGQSLGKKGTPSLPPVRYSPCIIVKIFTVHPPYIHAVPFLFSSFASWKRSTRSLEKKKKKKRSASLSHCRVSFVIIFYRVFIYFFIFFDGRTNGNYPKFSLSSARQNSLLMCELFWLAQMKNGVPLMFYFHFIFFFFFF